MNTRVRWALRQTVGWALGIVFVAWVSSWFGHAFLGLHLPDDLLPLAATAVCITFPLAWLFHPLEMRFRAWEADRARRGSDTR